MSTHATQPQANFWLGEPRHREGRPLSSPLHPRSVPAHCPQPHQAVLECTHHTVDRAAGDALES